MKQFKMYISTQINKTTTREKMLQPVNYILRKMDLKLQNLNFNIVCKTAFWNFFSR